MAGCESLPIADETSTLPATQQRCDVNAIRSVAAAEEPRRLLRRRLSAPVPLIEFSPQTPATRLTVSR